MRTPILALLPLALLGACYANEDQQAGSSNTQQAQAPSTDAPTGEPSTSRAAGDGTMATAP
jgi:hypothetical protein